MKAVEMTETLRKQGIQLLVLELTVRALMGTHPDHELLAGVMERLFASNEHAIREKGFELGMPPEAAQQFVDDFAEVCDGLLQVARANRPKP